MQNNGVKIGDVIEIMTGKGYAYAQYTHKHPQYGALLRVFRGLYASRPDRLEDILKHEIQFSTFFPLKAAVNRGITSVVANHPVDRLLQEFPLFRAGVVDPTTGKVAVWWLWDGQNEEKVGTLTNEQRKLPIRGVWNDTLLIERIESGWTPETHPT